MEISLRSPNLAAGTPLAPSPPTRWGLTCTPLCLPHNLPPLPIQKGKLKLTFHLPHTDFWQALPALRLPALQRAPPPSSEQPKPNRGTWGTRGTHPAHIPAQVCGQKQHPIGAPLPRGCCPHVPIATRFPSSLNKPRGVGLGLWCEGSRVSPGHAAGRCQSGRTLLPRLSVPSSGHKIGAFPFQNRPSATHTSGDFCTFPMPAAECPTGPAWHSISSPTPQFLGRGSYTVPALLV